MLPLDERTSIQGGDRPVLVVSNDVCNSVSTLVTVIPLTSQMKHLSQPTHVVLELKSKDKSMALAEQIMTIDKSQLYRCIDKIEGRETIGKIEDALREQLGMAQC